MQVEARQRGCSTKLYVQWFGLPINQSSTARLWCGSDGCLIRKVTAPVLSGMSPTSPPPLQSGTLTPSRHLRQALLPFDNSQPPGPSIPSANREKCVLLLREMLQTVIVKVGAKSGGTANE